MPIEIQLSGEALSELIYWTGKQWVVTSYGIEARDGTYIIAKTRLWRQTGTHDWIAHMQEKDWVDIGDFHEALIFAREKFGYHPKKGVVSKRK